MDRYRRMREVRFRLNNLLVKTVSKKTLEECGRVLGFIRKGTLFFESEDETSVLMDYCLYYPQPDGRNLIAKYLEESPPPPGSDEMAALQELTRAYYSLFQVLGVERGAGVDVRDLLRGGTGFIADVGFGDTARRHMMLATRIIPTADFLMTGGAALPVDASAAERISRELKRTGHDPGAFDFERITPRQEAEVAALIIRACRATGMSSHIAYAEPQRPGRPTSSGSGVGRTGRNDPCPCGSGKKFKTCCGRATG
jgi:hypothetical protein